MMRILFFPIMLAVTMPALAAEKPLTPADILHEAARHFAQLDLDHDGVLSAEERRLAQPGVLASLPRRQVLPTTAAVSITRLRATRPLPLPF